MTPDDIQDLFKRSEGEVQSAGGDDDETVLTDEERQYRIAHLRAVLLEAHNAWVSGSETLDRIAEKLGDGSRLGEFSSPGSSLIPEQEQKEHDRNGIAREQVLLTYLSQYSGVHQ